MYDKTKHLLENEEVTYMEYIEKAKKMNEIAQNHELTLSEKQRYVDTLTEEEMRLIFKDMMGSYYSKPE